MSFVDRLVPLLVEKCCTFVTVQICKMMQYCVCYLWIALLFKGSSFFSKLFV